MIIIDIKRNNVVSAPHPPAVPPVVVVKGEMETGLATGVRGILWITTEKKREGA
jgi:hypothetical protein